MLEKEIIISSDAAFRFKQEIEPVLSYIDESIQGKKEIHDNELSTRVKIIKMSLLELGNRITDWQGDTKEEIQGKRKAPVINFPGDTEGMTMDSFLKESTIVEINADSDKALVYMDNALMGKKRIDILYNPEKQCTFWVMNYETVMENENNIHDNT